MMSDEKKILLDNAHNITISFKKIYAKKGSQLLTILFVLLSESIDLDLIRCFTRFQHFNVILPVVLYNA